ncbi:hypothetical protein [Candidatus Uabimicrobium amorphum]|uniref:Uncharacterized protein n=1 Tax=Uabimicrobium amorphum TaxID=2596890 RepID=A0A5S9IN76_UABAM|nr:hypothetical protein [Candidatus Uabimicrobium amorphum]BBM84431.1 hypothetical protein UABAM_02791 [Candidatus Uabimicrobium amorphum]
MDLIDVNGKILRSYPTNRVKVKKARKQKEKSNNVAAGAATGVGTFFIKKFVEDFVKRAQNNVVADTLLPKKMEARLFSYPLSIASIMLARANVPEQQRKSVTWFGIAGMLVHELINFSQGNQQSKIAEFIDRDAVSESFVFGERQATSSKIFDGNGNEITFDEFRERVRKIATRGDTVELFFFANITNAFHGTIKDFIDDENITFREKTIEV